MARKAANSASAGQFDLEKCLTGIRGLDEIPLGGLPRGRPTLVCGAAGCGKTLLGMEFLVRGVQEFDEAAVCLSFDETAEELSRNVASLAFDVDALVAAGKRAIDYVFVEPSLTEETAEWGLEVLFVRLGQAIDSSAAKRALPDSVESLFAGREGSKMKKRIGPSPPAAGCDIEQQVWALRLYVAGQTSKSLRALANLKRICEEHLESKYRIEVIDLIENPQLATGDQILAIPTLVRKLPEPVRKIIGDLSDTERVLVGLDLRPRLPKEGV